MLISSFASGSSGNCTLVSSAGAAVLIDAGISLRRTQTRLRDLDISIDRIRCVFITHEHIDHIQGLDKIISTCHYRVKAPPLLCQTLADKYPHLSKYIDPIPIETPFQIADMTVRAFPTPHDVPQSVGYRISAQGQTFAIATDLGHVPESVFRGLLGADAVLIEANHDIDLLVNGPYPQSLKNRILSPLGHLCNEDCALLATELAESGTRCFMLGHISDHNNTPELALRTVRRAFGNSAEEYYIAACDKVHPVTLSLDGPTPYFY